MATAEELLNSLSNQADLLAAADDDDVFVIDAETRTITVPDSEALFGVKGDKNIERKYFRCPRYVGDGVDLSTHFIYIAYVYSSTSTGTFPTDGVQPYYCEDVAVDGDDITFSWKLSENVFQSSGYVAFKMYAKEKEDSPDTVFNTAPAVGTVLYTIDDGTDSIAEEYPDVINQLFARLQEIESGSVSDATIKQAVEDYLTKNPIQDVTIDSTLTQSGQAADAKATGDALSGKVNNSGWTANKYLGTDESGDVVEKDALASSGDGGTVSVEVESTTTGEPGTSASVTNTGDTQNVKLAFVIPRGETGPTGSQGIQGETGITPNITATATVDEYVGTPSVEVTKGGTDEAPEFSFSFHNLKGEKGESGESTSSNGLPSGGTTGQVLTKNSDADYDATWTDAPTASTTNTSRQEMQNTDANVTLEPNVLYVFPEMESLTVTLGTPSNTNIANEYHFFFTSGSTATTLTLNDVLSDAYSIEANMKYEVSILEGVAYIKGVSVDA